MTVIPYVKDIRLGSVKADAVYAGSTKVWPFKPTDLSGCVIWNDAATSFNAWADGTQTAGWNNLGSGPQPTSQGAAPYPTVRSNALNGNAVLRFTGGKVRFSYASTGIDKEWTIIYVARRWSSKAGRVIAANYSSSTTPNILVGFWSTGMDQCYVEGWIAGAGNPLTTWDWKLYSADSSAASVARFFVNGAFIAQGTATPAKGWNGTLVMASYDDGRSEDADCEFAEIVMYNRKITDTERQRVEGYLRGKWNPVAAFNPTQLGTNLLGWFDASDPNMVQLAGQGVNNWYNKGPGASMAIGQATDANRPTYANPIINFAISQGLGASSGPASFDCLVVAKPNPPGGGADWRTMLRSTDDHEMIIENGTTRFGCYRAGFYQAGGLTWDSVWGIGFVRTQPSGAQVMSRDGGPLYTLGVAMTATTRAPIGFGCYQGPPPSQGFGAVKEVILFPYGSTSLVPLLEGYLAWKWGLSPLLPSTHPYKNSPP